MGSHRCAQRAQFLRNLRKNYPVYLSVSKSWSILALLSLFTLTFLFVYFVIFLVTSSSTQGRGFFVVNIWLVGFALHNFNLLRISKTFIKLNHAAISICFTRYLYTVAGNQNFVKDTHTKFSNNKLEKGRLEIYRTLLFISRYVSNQ